MAGNRAFFPTLHDLREEVGRGKNEVSSLCGSRPSAQTLRKWEAGSPGSYTLVSKVFNVISSIYASENDTTLNKREHVFRLSDRLIATDGHYSAHPDLETIRTSIGKRPSEVASEVGMTASDYKLVEGYSASTCHAAPTELLERILDYYRARIVIDDTQVIQFIHRQE